MASKTYGIDGKTAVSWPLWNPTHDVKVVLTFRNGCLDEMRKRPATCVVTNPVDQLIVENHPLFKRGVIRLISVGSTAETAKTAEINKEVKKVAERKGRAKARTVVSSAVTDEATGLTTYPEAKTLGDVTNVLLSLGANMAELRGLQAHLPQLRRLMRLYLSNAIEFVRARMDELPYDNDDMIVPADDDRNFDVTVERLLPEAAEFICRAAPSGLLEPQGEIAVPSPGTPTDGILSSELRPDGSIAVTIDLDGGFLRMVSFKADDSDIFVTGAVPFDSPKARMQVNPYTRGTYDDPVVVERKSPRRLFLEYYSVRDKESAPGFRIGKIDKPSWSQDADGKSIFSPDFLVPAVLNRLTGMVLETYGSAQQAQAFYQKSATYIA